ncbi:MAG: hypothetical protein Q8O26_01860 [Phreatobacter sp.]|uniref:hypothetical protein n=1 Tax=Phreatobacter sp. TaxID=1966341 RepID=UPI002736F81F|nr:hypothetical protein [Phreatobacter sp.]MDP2800605.1 hypothetical protein [Phreatobacter sp.]
MIDAFTLLVLLHLIGDITAHLTGLPIPGPVIAPALVVTVSTLVTLAVTALIFRLVARLTDPSEPAASDASP